MEHMLVHWDDIMACLLDELIQEEVIELNRLDSLKEKQVTPMLADKSMLGKFHDYKSVDLRDITAIFDEYHKAEQKIITFMNL